jgi:serine/threonine protein phosphatase PrpC
MICPNCGYENRETARFCHRCGAALTPQSPAGPDVSRRPTEPFTRPLPGPPPRGGGEDQGAESVTRPLPEASVAFAPLPEGALLHGERYAVSEVRTVNERLNVYLVEDNTPVRLCPNCRVETSDPQERFCPLCGADLSDVEPLHIHYLMQESADERAFAVEAQLLEMRLEHPGLLLPREVFAEAPYGPTRHYMVEPEFSPSLASSLPVPQELNQVLEWGVSLAQALDYLHRCHVTLHEVDPSDVGYINHIAIVGKKAHWTHLNVAYVTPPAARSTAASYFAQDVQGLATALLYLATGKWRATPIPLPEQITTTFSQALTAPTRLSAATFATALETALQERRRPASVTLVVGRRTDVGQERSLNEDSLLTLDISPVYRSISAPMGLFVVADGMGGHEAGEVASQTAIRAIARQAVSEVLSPAAVSEPLPDIRQWLTATALTANREVYDQRKAAGTDMGTTLVMALVVGDTATIANVGDSRAYLLKQDGIVQITTDHSLVERLVATGQITPQEAANHPQRNVIYRVIGDKPQVETDLFEQRLAPGEALLLCSDGLSGMMPDKRIWNIWSTSTSPQEACDRLIEAANQAGGEDNITVVIVQIVG